MPIPHPPPLPPPTPQDYEAREKMHYAACVAGMAMSNAFLGACHSLAHTMGGRYHVPHGLANSAFLSHIICYNSSDKPFKVGGRGCVCGGEGGGPSSATPYVTTAATGHSRWVAVCVRGGQGP